MRLKPWAIKALNTVDALSVRCSASTVPKGLYSESPDSSIDEEYEFNAGQTELCSGDEFDSEEEEEMSMEVSYVNWRWNLVNLTDCFNNKQVKLINGVIGELFFEVCNKHAKRHELVSDTPRKVSVTYIWTPAVMPVSVLSFSLCVRTFSHWVSR